MTVTLEARWFGPPPLPEPFRAWFEPLGAIDTTSQTDLYLPTEDTALNLKLRDGQFQIKRRLAGPFRTALTPDASARCEQWGKWSFDLCDDSARPSETEDPTALWVPVAKTRHQLSIPPEDQSSLSPDLPTAPPARIDLELTTIEALDDEAWTFCLEAEGPVPSLRDTLLTTAPILLADFPGSLPDDQSFGYSRWLHQHPSVTPGPAPSITIPSPE